TSAISLSLEGKSFWIVKSLPIKPQSIMLAKLIFNILLGFPFAVLAILLMGIAFEINVFSLMTMIGVALSISLSTSAIGSFINLHFPKFEFMNETEVVKQSVGALIGVFAGFGILVIDGVIVYFAMDQLGQNLALLLGGLANIAVFGIFLSLVLSASDRLFAKMKA
ncbi:MAG: hypothetical protein WC251_01360, partial [Candidatus Izemoplasmatales bacterium]